MYSLQHTVLEAQFLSMVCFLPLFISLQLQSEKSTAKRSFFIYCEYKALWFNSFFCLVFLHRRNKTHTLLKIASSTWFCSSALFNCGKFQLQWTSLRGLSSPSTLLFSLGEGDVFLDYGWKVDPSGFSCVLLLMSVLQMQSSHLYLEGYHMGRAWQLYIAVHMDQLSVLLIIHLRSNFLLPSSLAACWRALNSIVLQILMSSWVSGPWGWEAEF